MSGFDEFTKGMPLYIYDENQAVLEALHAINYLAEFRAAHEAEIENMPIDAEFYSALEAAGYSEENHIPVFIILTKGHTPLSKIIFAATGDEHSHASIAFDISLRTMYSFGTKKISPTEMGFATTSFDSEIWGEIPTEYDMYVTYTNREGSIKMHKTLEYFVQNSDKLKYHWGGLVKIFFNIKSNNQKKFICSRFVAMVLGEGIKLGRDASLYRPSQLRDIENVEFVISGPSIREYDERKAKAALDKVRRQ